MISLKTSEYCIEEFNNLKMNSKYGYIIFKINEQQEMEIEDFGNSDYEFEEIQGRLLPDQPRFIVATFKFITDDVPARHVGKLIFITWCPDTSNLKQKFLYASGVKSFKGKLEGIGKSIQASEYSDIDYDKVKVKFV